MEQLVDLSWSDGIGVVLSTRSGVFYTNQTHGLACEHPREEGVYFPLPELSIDAPRQMLRRFQEHFRGGWDHILEDDADFLDRELQSLGLDFVRVDRGRLNESFEAWVRICIQPGSDLRFSSLVQGFDGASGVLTWPNSD